MRLLALAMILTAGIAPLAQAAKFTATVHDAAGKPIADAVVYISNGASQDVAKPTKAVVDQLDKEFVPRMTVVQTGTAIEFPNSDNFRHQVYSFSPARPFTLKLYSGRPSAPVLFDKPGVIVLGCNIHDRMVGWVLALDTPWYAKVDSAGHATLENLPAGNYSIAVWQAGLQQPINAGTLQLGASDRIERTLLIANPTGT
jgi:plastocyanin